MKIEQHLKFQTSERIKTTLKCLNFHFATVNARIFRNFDRPLCFTKLNVSACLDVSDIIFIDFLQIFEVPRNLTLL